MKNTIVKELFFILIMIIIIFVTLRLVLYDFIPTKNEIKQAFDMEYKAAQKVLDVIEEIEKSEGISNANEVENEKFLKTYTIEQKDLKNYVSNKSYESGKKDPFEDSIETNKKKSTNSKNNTNKKR